MIDLVRLPIAEHGPEHIDPPSSEGDERLLVSFPLAPFPVIEGAAFRRPQRAVGRLVKHPLEMLVATSRAPEVTGLAGLPEHRRQARRSGESVRRSEPVDRAGRGNEVGREDDAHSREAAQQRAVGMTIHQSFQFAVDRDDACPRGQRIGEPAKTSARGANVAQID